MSLELLFILLGVVKKEYELSWVTSVEKALVKVSLTLEITNITRENLTSRINEYYKSELGSINNNHCERCILLSREKQVVVTKKVIISSSNLRSCPHVLG